MTSTKSLTIVAGASTGIGYELAKLCVENGFDLVVAADETEIHAAAERLQSLGASVEAVEADLATIEGVDKLYGAQALNCPVDALFANAGRGLGRLFSIRISPRLAASSTPISRVRFI